MPELFRKIFPSTATTVPPDRDRNGAVRAEALQAIPTGLARCRAETLAEMNGPCRAVLREVVGASDQANVRWLEAAVARLRARGRDREILAGRSETLNVEVRLGPVCPETGEAWVAVRQVNRESGGHDDLVETVSTLSHELRTPLTSMKSSLALVRGGDAGPVAPDQERFLDMTLRNIERLDRLVSDLLDVSRAGTGVAPLRAREVDLGPVLREAVQLQESAARVAGLELDASGLPERLRAHADPDHITQIVANVVGNSIKYTPGGGLVRIWVESRPRPDEDLAWRLAEDLFLPLHTYNLVVEDSGVGMTPQEIERVFEPWFRGRRPAADTAPGSGLGLHITRGLVEAHGGRIRLASTPGRGTTVWIRLPRDPASEKLLRAARELRELARRADADTVAILDGRPERPLHDLVEDFLGRRPDPAATKVVEPARSLAACVVADREDFVERWTAFAARRPSTAALPAWRFVGLGAEMETMSQFPGLEADHLEVPRPVPGPRPGSPEA